MNRGYILLWRKLQDNPAWKNPTLLKVFLWCLYRASHEDNVVPVKTGRGTTDVKIKRGQFIYGRHAAAKELQMKPSTTRDKIEKLKKLKILDTQPDTHFSIITVCNYDVYQSGGNLKRQPTRHPTRQPTDNQPDTKKELRKNYKELGNKAKESNSFFSKLSDEDKKAVQDLTVLHLKLYKYSKSGQAGYIRNKLAIVLREYGPKLVEASIRFMSPVATEGDGLGIVLDALKSGVAESKLREDSYETNLIKDKKNRSEKQPPAELAKLVKNVDTVKHDESWTSDERYKQIKKLKDKPYDVAMGGPFSTT